MSSNSAGAKPRPIRAADSGMGNRRRGFTVRMGQRWNGVARREISISLPPAQNRERAAQGAPASGAAASSLARVIRAVAAQDGFFPRTVGNQVLIGVARPQHPTIGRRYSAQPQHAVAFCQSRL